MGLNNLLGLQLLALVTFSPSSSLTSIHSVPSAKEKWQLDILAEQDLHSILINIDEKLRVVDSLQYRMNLLKIAMERIDERTTRFQNLLQRRIDPLSQTLTSLDIKHELLLDQFTKYESTQDRLFHKISSVEGKLEEISNKIQINQESNFIRIENKLNDLHNKINEVFIHTSNIKLHTNNLEDRINDTNKDLINHFKSLKNDVPSNDKFDKLASTLDGIHNHLNQSDSMWTQNDGPRSTEKEREKIIDTIRVELSSEAQKVGNKVNNMYHEIWKRISTVEGIVKNGFSVNNSTQNVIIEGLRSLISEQRDSENFIDINIAKVTSILQKKFNELYGKVDDNFDTIVSAQNLFMESCHRIQKDEPILESKVSQVLEKILDAFLNKTTKIERLATDLLEGLKSHNSQIMRTATHTTNMLFALTEKNKQDHKDLDGSIHEVSGRTDAVATLIEELQEEITDLNSTILQIIPKNNTLLSLLMLIEASKRAESFKPFTNSTKFDNANINIEDVNNLESDESSNGIVKILTDLPPKQSLDSRSHPTNFPTEIKQMFALDPYQKLNLILSNYDSDTNRTSNKLENYKNKDEMENASPDENFISKIQNKNESESININYEEITNEMASKLIMRFISLIKREITISEFLNENYTNNKYKNLSDMIENLKFQSIIPKDFIRELEEYNANNNDFEILGKQENTDSFHEDDYDETDDY